jgi:hypothetical protein
MLKKKWITWTLLTGLKVMHYAYFMDLPLSVKMDKLAYSPVNMVGKILSNGNEKDELLSMIKDNTKVIFKSV